MIQNVKETLTSLLKSIDSNKFTGNGDGIYLNTQIEVSVFNKSADALVKAGVVTVGDVIEITNEYKAKEMLEYTIPEKATSADSSRENDIVSKALDSQGRLHKVVTTNKGDEEPRIITYTFGNSGDGHKNKLWKINYDRGDLHSETVYSYDEYGRISQKYDSSLGRKNLVETYYEYYHDENNQTYRLKSMTTVDGDDRETINYSYNKKGYLKTQQKSGKDGWKIEYDSKLLENLWTEIRDLDCYNSDGSLNIKNAITVIQKVKQSGANLRETQWIMQSYLGCGNVLEAWNAMCGSDIGYKLSDNTSVTFILTNEHEKDTRKVLEYTDIAGNKIAYDINGNKIED